MQLVFEGSVAGRRGHAAAPYDFSALLLLFLLIQAPDDEGVVVSFLLQVHDGTAALHMAMRELYRPAVLHWLPSIDGVAFQQGRQVVPDQSETFLHTQVQSNAAL